MSELALKLGRRLNETRGICAKYYKEKREIYTFFRQYSMRLDNLTLTLWNELFGHLPDCTLIATGGVGRREVYPNSDLDLAILLGKPMDSLTETTVSLFVQILWDAGFNPSVAVGDEDQLARSCAEDLSRDTSFLESRFLAGDLRAYCDLCDRLTAQRDLPAFLRGKIEEISIRRGKTRDSGYLEPNIKLCPGGLRDAHCMMWMAKAMGYSTDLKSLVSTGALNAREAKMLNKSYKTLARVRIELHLLSRKAGDELLFDNQVIVAKNLGFDCSTPKRASESLMRKVRQATRSLIQISGIVVPLFAKRAQPLRIARCVARIPPLWTIVDGELEVNDKTAFETRPETVFETMRVFQSRADAQSIEPETLRAWWRASLRGGDRLRDAAESRKAFLELFQDGRRLGEVMNFLHVYGVLGRQIPEFGRVTGLLQHDLFHIYPVDVHSLAVLEHMKSLESNRRRDDHFELAASLMKDFEPKRALYLAALLHDVGKGMGGQHEIKGAKIAERFARKSGLPRKEADLLEWLVLNHLLLSVTSQKHDIENPEVVREFCERVGDKTKLTALYILTVCDIYGTNPKIWTDWKDKLTASLFRKASACLSGGNAQAPASPLDEKMRNALTTLLRLGCAEPEAERRIAALGESYFQCHDEEEIRWHLEKLTAFDMGRDPGAPRGAEPKAHPDGAAQPKRSGRRDEPNEPGEPQSAKREGFALCEPDNDGALRLMAYVEDGPRLFAKLCQIIAASGFNVLKARIFLTGSGMALDTFHLGLSERLSEFDYAARKAKLDADLEAFARGAYNPDVEPLEPPKRRLRSVPVPCAVSLTSESAAAPLYRLEVSGPDRKGLLANIAQALSDLDVSVRSAIIYTLGERAEDSFLILAPQLLDDPVARLNLKNRIRAAVDDA